MKIETATALYEAVAIPALVAWESLDPDTTPLSAIRQAEARYYKIEAEAWGEFVRRTATCAFEEVE